MAIDLVSRRAVCVAILWTCHSPAAVAAAGPDQPPVVAELSPQQLLNLANAAAQARDLGTAEAAYEALGDNRSSAIRNEARYRLAQIRIGQGRLTAAAILLRTILDEEPGAQRVRLELARLLEQMGDEAGALRMLRAAQAGGLPPDVARLVDRYSAALRSRKPLGASLEVALAPDSNINRATRSDTLGTVLGDFTLDEAAKPRSGLGLALRGQAYVRQKVTARTSLIGRVSGSADLYGEGRFNDLALGVSGGPEVQLGRDRLTTEIGRIWRWYGGELYARNWTLSASYAHPLDRKSQLRTNVSLGSIDNQRNDLQDGHNYSLSASYERALSQRAGLGINLSVERQSLADPAYSLTGGSITLFAYREVGAATLFASVGFARQVADDRLALLPERRSDHLYKASIGATLRSIRLGGFAPLLRATVERNRSTVELHDYRRVRLEAGITRAF